MSNRQYLSGSEKRKLRKEKEASIKRLPSVSKYFSSAPAPTNEQNATGMYDNKLQIINNCYNLNLHCEQYFVRSAYLIMELKECCIDS